MMRYILKYFIKRLPREGFKSMSVSALALALVFLINVMAGVRADMQAEYDDTIDNYPIIVEVSDGDGTATEGLRIGENYLMQFSEPEALWSLSSFVNNVQLTRTLDIVEEPGPTETGRLIGCFDEWSVREYLQNNYGMGISDFAYVIFDEYADYTWEQYTNTCIVGEDVLDWAEDGFLRFSIIKKMGPNTRVYDFSLLIVGTVSSAGMGGHVFCTYSTAANIISSTGSQLYESNGGVYLRYSDTITVYDQEFRLIRRHPGEMQVDYFEGYSSSTAQNMQDKYYCVVSEDVMEFVEDGILPVRLFSAYNNEHSFAAELTVIGVLTDGGEGIVVSTLGNLSYLFFLAREIQFTPKIPVVGYMRGVTSMESVKSIVPGTPARVEFYDGYDESIFSSDENVCVVSEDMMKYAVDGVFIADVRSGAGAYAKNVEAALRIVGTVSGAGEGVVYAPFSIVSLLGGESDGGTPYTESIRATVADNRNLVGFKYEATRTFKEVGVFFNTQTFSMTIYDAEFYNITEALMQTIFFIDIAMPFVYIIAICVGFIASFLLTRRRKAEFASMRSLGVNKMKIFFGTLFEQALLCALGVIISCLVFYFTWGYFFYERALIFLGCYVLGAVISAAKAAGTNVLRLLREKE